MTTKKSAPIHEAETSLFGDFSADDIKETAATVANQVSKTIKKHPLASVGGALLVGLMLGLMMNRKKDE